MRAREKLRDRRPSGAPSASRAQLRALWDAQGGRCGLTGIPLALEEAELDHIIPASKGGSHTIDNLRWVHRVTNRAKWDRTDEEFFAWLDQVIAVRSLLT